jgi:hypothetical protein
MYAQDTSVPTSAIKLATTIYTSVLNFICPLVALFILV